VDGVPPPNPPTCPSLSSHVPATLHIPPLSHHQTSPPASPDLHPATAAAAAYTRALAAVMAEAAAAIAAGHGGGGGGGASSASAPTTPLDPVTPFADAGLDSLDMLRVR
jgi:hypothetical protein